MPRSQLEIAAERFNAQLKAVDDAAVRKMLQLYEPARKRLLVKITQLIEEIEKTGVTTAGNVYKLDRWTELVNQIDREIARISPTAAQIVQDGQGAATTMAKDHSIRLAQAAVPAAARAEIAVSWNKVPTKAIDQLVGRLQDGSPIREWIDEVAPKMIAKFEEEIVTGMTQGQHPSVISARLGGIVDVEQSRLDQMVRDSVLNSYRSASLNTYAENADILDGWHWLSAHDGSTCGACLGLDDGRIFPLSETFFEAHSRCRCSPSPVVSGFPPIQRETGEEWLLKQSDEHQDALLGKAAGQAFRDGEVKLEDFIAKREDPKWGDSFVQGSFRDAEKRAAARMEEAVPAPSITPFSPAGKVAEAEEYARSLGVETVIFGDRNIVMANKVNEALAQSAERGIPLPKGVRVIDETTNVHVSKKMVAGYGAETDTIYLNPKNAYWKDETNAKVIEQSEAGWWSSPDPLHPVTHEIGHQAHAKSAGLDEYNRGVSQQITGDALLSSPSRESYATRERMAKEVSRYGVTNANEFVAEIFAGRQAGNVYSEEAMAFYRALGGPEL